MLSDSPFLWYRDKDSLQIGGVSRYVIRYRSPRNLVRKEIYLRLKNVEKTSIRAIHLLNGPFIVYAHVVPHNYDHRKPFKPEDSNHNSEVRFENQIKPGQTFNVRLALNKNSLVADTLVGDDEWGQNRAPQEPNVALKDSIVENEREVSQRDPLDTLPTITQTPTEPEHLEDSDYAVYGWTLDIVSQIVITKNTSVEYDLLIGDDFASMKRLNHGSLQSTLTNLGPKKSHVDLLDRSSNPNCRVKKLTAKDLWATQPKYPKKPFHLVLVTHGVFLNLTADMLYVKEILESRAADQNVVVKGYAGNAGKTEKGVKRLGTGCAEYIVELLDQMADLGYKVDRISFVAHSLGGPVQLYALKHILVTHGNDFFKRRNIRLEHLVFLASPLLGVLSEMSFLISWFLDLGTLGKTGRDLTLLKKMPSLKAASESKMDTFKPILETIPDDPVGPFLESFRHLTVYANAVNDGIVPLRTSALLYLDYGALGDVKELKKERNHLSEGRTLDQKETEHGNTPHLSPNSPGTPRSLRSSHRVHSLRSNNSASSEISTGTVGEVPDDDETDKKPTITEKYRAFLKLNFNLEKPKMSRRERAFLRISAKGEDPKLVRSQASAPSLPQGTITADYEEPKSPDDLSGHTLAEAHFEKTESLNIPPRALAVESALNTLICPVPSSTYIDEPELRDGVIFHDKIYRFDSTPEPLEVRRSTFGKVLFRYTDWKHEKQVKIARKYHRAGLRWRKVLVSLPPDAHNNIIVRRRFANGYGWDVVEHLAEMFASEEDDDTTLKAKI